MLIELKKPVTGLSGPNGLRQRLAVTTALATAFFAGYGGRNAYAGACSPLSAGTYECSGPLALGTDVTQALSGASLTVTTTAGFGIDTSTSGGNAFILTGTDGLTFTDNYASNITGSWWGGIFAINKGSGALSVTATGAVTGTTGYGYGIYAFNNGTDLTVGVADVTGGTKGINARNDGSGVLSIATTGTVTGGTDFGIQALNYGTDLTITAADVVGGVIGISARNSSSGRDLTIIAADVTGGTEGIYARNDGSGALTITTSGTVTGSAPDAGFLGGYGIYARNFGTDLSIMAADVTGNYHGIHARNSGSGALSIMAANVRGTGFYTADGIFAFNDGSGTGLTVMAADVSAYGSGIIAVNAGSGALSITTTGTVSGTPWDGNTGIRARNNGTDLTIIAADVYGGNGVSASNNGSGALSITTIGTVTGRYVTFGRGISAYNSGTDLTVIAADVTGRDRGIDARNAGSGALSISAANVTADDTGIDARNYGSGALSITTSGTVTGTYSNDGTYGSGISARNKGTDLTITAVDVIGDITGIFALNEGSGALSITAVDVNSNNYNFGSGVFARNNGTDLTIIAADVSGGYHGISALNLGAGALSIIATGTITGSGTYNTYENYGTYGVGVFARNYGTELTIIATGVTGGGTGINAINDGSGLLSITATGAVTGGTGVGIQTQTGAGKSTVITLNNGASVSAASGIAISNDDGDSQIAINAGASVVGMLQLSGGTDEVTVVNGGFLGGGGVDGGNLTVEAGGTLGPGFSPGIMTVTGDLDVLSNAILSFELGGSAAGSGYDQLDIFGDAMLEAGTVFDISSYLGFLPSNLGTFDILLADSITGDPLTSLSFNYSGFGSATWTESIVQVGGREALRLTASTSNTSPVPVSSSLMFALSGSASIFGLGWMRRRKHGMAA